LQDCIAALQQQWRADHYITVKARSGKTRTLDQNALLHIWCRQLVAQFATVLERDVTAQQVEDMKTSLKRGFYRATASPWVLRDIRDSLTGEMGKSLRSTTDYDTGQMFEFMDWVQGMAMVDLGILLEAKGEFAEHKSTPG